MSVFAPLSLTQTLPFLPLAQGDIDYQVDRRSDPHLFEDVFAQPSTSVMLVCAGKVAVPFGQGALIDYANVTMRLASLPGSYMVQELDRHPEAIALYLGSYGGRRDEHVVAIDVTEISRACESRQGRVPDSANSGADDDFDDMRGTPRGGNGHPSLLEQALTRFDWVDIRGFAPHASAREAGQATSATTLSMWHMRQRFCPTCSAPVSAALGGWAQRCTNREDGNRMLFPRIEPAVITAVVDSRDRLLLQHNNAWENPTLYSVSAGFVEAGENLEHASRRETLEETGITVGDVRYLGSQPWPFPASLMVAFKAYALSCDIRVDGKETADARWMDRDGYMQALLSGRMSVPGRSTIARYMIEQWYGSELPQA
jgi:NAD+ diphosphatase